MADWDIFIDETKEGGRLKSLAVLVFEAGVTEGILHYPRESTRAGRVEILDGAANKSR